MNKTTRTTKDIVRDSRVVRFRQSLNLFSKNWTRVSIYDPTMKKWVKVDRQLLLKIVNKKYGYCMAIYRAMRLFEAKKDMYKRPMWKVSGVSKSRSTFGNNTYSVFEFTCTRQKHDISGVM